MRVRLKEKEEPRSREGGETRNNVGFSRGESGVVNEIEAEQGAGRTDRVYTVVYSVLDTSRYDSAPR